ncbi:MULTISPECIES: type II toxin-antitoxin system Phd/YefM family antitoxin [Rugamonas]|jgi:prevent-host-death family protein|uniref:Antitoxin n=1 Tax=Rugamonas rubra TaxID=758825 RepID=A0A1I4Q9C9_9BURK|nr:MULTISPECIES: type II toxin-antitoxin system prevent-host-death family antitoxin [Rugamonas]WGG50643.1 type II toxin-antitoxin system prevent-host-death family antitoxin [Rugamonas sp. DEMB1]SFM36701.1 prevent-host-death family protein [Rugamonas rubra]
MHTFTLAQAKAQLSRLIDMVEAGEDVTITKRGRAVVRLVPSSPPRQQLPSLAEFRAGLPEQAQPAGEFIRQLRESDRY